GSPKQLLLLPRVLERLRQTSVDEIVVVAGAHELDPPAAIRVVRCPEWARGPGASLRCGLASLEPRVECAVVVLADGPHLAPAAVERVLDAWRVQGGIVAASYDGARGHPLVLGRSAWAGVPDDGLRDYPATLVPCADVGARGDVDTEEDLAGR